MVIIVCVNIVVIRVIGVKFLITKKYSPGWVGGWMDGWVNGWMDVKAVLRIAYSNQKKEVEKFNEQCSN